MQFIKGGPDVPDDLLRAHEEGRVVFFCGAGISCPAGLPGFGDLVLQIYDGVGESRNELEEHALKQGQYDATLDLFERRVGRATVRRQLAKVLKPNLRRKGAKETHAALLLLARTRKDQLRLVTTNFDRVFEYVIAQRRLRVSTYAAPLLPIPKKSRWQGLVYLHGLLPDEHDEGALHRLVLTSGDFGLAYLTERWAARFVSELFRSYVVCFVGYSINDPVLRYMMDALAADRMMGESTPQAYAFGDSKGEDGGRAKVEWEAKGVVPILYRVSESGDHSSLHSTLKAWAETYRDSLQGKERIVAEAAAIRPSLSTPEDDFIGRVLWALSDASGKPARRFADFDPVPSLDWLEPISECRYRQKDLPRFGVTPQRRANEKLIYSLTRRPTPYDRAPLMELVSGVGVQCELDPLMVHLARWLTRHLNEPKLLLWVVRQGGQVHETFARRIEERLDEIHRLEQDEDAAELERMRSNAPNAIPDLVMRTLWRLLLAGQVKSSPSGYDLYRWKEQLDRDGLSTTLRFTLRQLLAPKLTLSEPFHPGEGASDANSLRTLAQLVRWELMLAADGVDSWLSEMSRSEIWRQSLTTLLADFHQLLRDALDLQHELGDADGWRDSSYWDLPSISDHRQNRHGEPKGWIALVVLLRDAWVAVHNIDRQRAKQIATDWLLQPYPTFRRLALFAATHEDIAPAGEWVEWLRSNDGWCLWSRDTQRETMRLLVLKSASLPLDSQAHLEAAILAGPPHGPLREEIEEDLHQRPIDRATWLRLAKLELGGCALGVEAKGRLSELSKRCPEWKLLDDERDEFRFWISGTGDPDFEERREVDRVPLRRRDIVGWLKQAPSKSPFYEDDWFERCRDSFFPCAFALSDLGSEGKWPALRWSQALQAWSDAKVIERSWSCVAPLLQMMPDAVLLRAAHSVGRWLEAASKVLDKHEDIFVSLFQRILALEPQGPLDSADLLSSALNDPVGKVAEALLNFWLRRQPHDNTGLPADLKPLFIQLCDTQVARYRPARVILSANLIALFRVDPDWTSRSLLPLFSWRVCPAEARAVWDGFLWSAHLYQPLLAALKPALLEAAGNYASLGGRGRRYATLLTYSSLDRADTFTVDELRKAFGALPAEGLKESAQALVRVLNGAGDQRNEQWKNRVSPFLHDIWPKSRDSLTPDVAEQFALLAIAAGDEFPVALSMLDACPSPPQRWHYVVGQLRRSGLCGRFPEPALQLLEKVMADQSWPSPDLDTCLHDIAKAWPGAKDDHRYRRLMAIR